MDPRRTPQPILSTHLPDQFAGLLAYRRSSRSSAPDLAGPEQLKTRCQAITVSRFTMTSAECQSLQTRHSQAQKNRSATTRFRPPLGGALEDADLMSKGDILQLQGGSRSQ